MNATTSLAALLLKPGELVLRERPVPRPGPGEVLVKVGACAICGSDFHLIDGHTSRARLPVVPGHELMGRVMELGEGVTGIEIGDRACIENHVACGECRYCRAGRENLCNSSRSIGVTVDGGYSQHVVVPAKCIIPVPDALDDATASVMQTLGTGYHVVRTRGHVRKGETVAVLGMGPVGLCILACAKFSEARVVALDTVDDRLEAARRMGADETVNVTGADPVEAVRALTDGEGAEVAFEVVGGTQTKTVPQAIEMVCKGGRVVIVGEFSDTEPTPIAIYPLQHMEKEIIGSRGHPDTFRPCIEHAATGELDVAVMITHQVPLEMVHEGIRLMRERRDGAIKVVLRPNGMG